MVTTYGQNPAPGANPSTLPRTNMCNKALSKRKVVFRGRVSASGFHPSVPSLEPAGAENSIGGVRHPPPEAEAPGAHQAVVRKELGFKV